jgi:hypothetical protein
MTLKTRFRRAMRRGDQRIVAETLASDARRDRKPAIMLQSAN